MDIFVGAALIDVSSLPLVCRKHPQSNDGFLLCRLFVSNPSLAGRKAKGMKFNTFVRKLEDVDRAILDGHDVGFVKIHTKEGSDVILGATIVATDAGNLISEVSVAMQAGMGLGAIANVIHPYPTQADAIRQVGDMYNRTKLTPFVKSIFRNLLEFRRS